MKKCLVLVAGALMLCLVLSGCGKKEADVDQQVQATIAPTETPVERVVVEMQQVDKNETPAVEIVETNVIGVKSDTASKMTIINKTGSEVSYIYIRPNTDDDEEWGNELINQAFTLKTGEQATYYYDKGAAASLYDIRIGYAEEGRNECFFRKIPLNTITQITLCMDGVGEDSIPYARYLTGNGMKEYSTLNEVKQRLGLLDEDEDEDEEDEEETEETEKNEETPEEEEEEPEDLQPSDNPDEEEEGDTENQPEEEEEEPETNNAISAAEDCIGQPLSKLINACGEPNGTTYEDEPETGETGYHYYDGFTVSTTVDEEGNEIVAGVW